MTKQKRLRIFAGPNGSGKTTLARKLASEGKFHLPTFVNADIIEQQLTDNGIISLKDFNIDPKNEETIELMNRYGILNDSNLGDLLDPAVRTFLFDERANYFTLIDHHLHFTGNLNSYIAAHLATFIRETLLIQGESFAFETVFSHPSKKEFMERAIALGYRVYLYFISTKDPSINVNRVALRVAKNGHPVAEEKIVSRYFRSLDLLYDAVKTSHRSYLFDNSTKYYNLVSEINKGKNVEVFDEIPPNWFMEYFYEKVVR